jgi:hypothetical protein
VGEGADMAAGGVHQLAQCITCHAWNADLSSYTKSITLPICIAIVGFCVWRFCLLLEFGGELSFDRLASDESFLYY